MRHAALRLAACAAFGLGILGTGTAFAQGEQEGAEWQRNNVWQQQAQKPPSGYQGPRWVPRQGPGWRHHNPGWGYGPGWRHQRPWYGPSVGIYVEPAPRYYSSRRYYTRPATGSAHVEWCYGQYRSYRASDNTWQPYQGPRRQCVSPYS